MSHKLVEIPTQDWPKLRDLYIRRKKQSCGYYTVNNFIDWQRQEPNVDVKFYSLDGDWEADGTFVIIKHKCVYFNTVSDNYERLSLALKCIEHTEPMLYYGFAECYAPMVDSLYIEMGCKVPDYKTAGTFWYHLLKEKAAQLEESIPEGFSLAPLQIEHADQINAIWPFRSEGSVKFVKCIIIHNDNVGVFDNAGCLIAWCLRLPLGSLGLLQVTAEYKRRGFASLVVSHMAKLFAARGEDVFAPVVHSNIASRSMFEKLGFKPIDKVYWALKSAHE